MRRVGPLLLGVALATARASESPTPEQVRFFETRIRPVLAERCYECHSANARKLKGNLMLDSRAGVLRGGEDGPAVVPGDLDKSLLMHAIRYHDADRAMPPKAKGGKLADAVIADFEQWIRMGAPDPRGAAPTSAQTTESEDPKRQKLWSFEMPLHTQPPHPKRTGWARNDIDLFLLDAMEAEGLKPVADADRRTLIRRAAYDLTGLPPTHEEVAAFVQDTSVDAFERVVNHYLASPRFGECWGRHWLDVARYAESSGRNVNFIYAQAWRYRDYVIDAFNNDKPYDQFLKEQLAGDLLPFANARDQAAKLIATGFLALGPKSHDELDSQKFRMDVADEQIDAVSQSMLGLTIACARCHDHKQDPITQRDYYALAGIFLSTETLYGTCYELQNWHATSLIELNPEAAQPSALQRITPAEVAQLDMKVRKARQAAYEASFHRDTDRYHARLTREEASFAQAQWELFKSDGVPRTLVMGVLDLATPNDALLLIRGETSQPAEIVPRGVVHLLCESEPPPIRRGSGRLELANFIASEHNSLTARVMVNRVWAKLFGRGIVATPDNFGAMGARPTHPKLLDNLALSFIDNGWSVKQLIRQIMLSRAYQLGPGFDESNHANDPDNLFLWRMSKKRLSAEAMRDAMLSLSGQLDLNPSPGSLVARLDFDHDGPGRAVEEIRRHPSLARSVFQPVIRGRVPEFFSTFDFADPSVVTGQRESTNVPAQDLHLLADEEVQGYAKAFASRVSHFSGTFADKACAAFELALSRPPNDGERRAVDAFVEQLSTKLNMVPSPAQSSSEMELRLLSAFSQALFECAEFRYLN